MSWTQVNDPLNSMVLSALAAAIPVLFIFWALIIKKMKGYLASLLTLIVAILFAVLVYKMPLTLAMLSGFNGILYERPAVIPDTVPPVMNPPETNDAMYWLTIASAFHLIRSAGVPIARDM